jgi:UTP--glucose-1-phosphate uridylyltransferase
MQETKPAQSSLDKAVIPAAGFGSRMLPITKSIPKEMLPFGRKPVIQLLVEEAVRSGLTQVCIVIRRGKEIIEEYFQAKPRKSDASTLELESLLAECRLSFVYQKEPLGIGDALLEAGDFVGADSFVMIVPDQLMRAEVPATLQLVRRWQPGSYILSSMVRIPKEETHFFESSKGVEIENEYAPGEFVIGRLQTKEETARAYRDQDYEVRGFGRTVYPPEIFDYLGRNFINPRTGEVDLSMTFEKLAGVIPHRGVMLEGLAQDLGTFEGYYHYLPRTVESGS